MAASLEEQSHNSPMKELDRIFDFQKKDFAASPYPDARERIDNLKVLKSLMLDNRERIVEAISEDFGCRAKSETIMCEMLVAAEGIKYAIEEMSQIKFTGINWQN